MKSKPLGHCPELHEANNFKCEKCIADAVQWLKQEYKKELDFIFKSENARMAMDKLIDEAFRDVTKDD